MSRRWGGFVIAIIMLAAGFHVTAAPSASAAEIKTIAPLPSGRHRVATAFDGTRAYITGGFTSGPPKPSLLDVGIDPVTGEVTERQAPNVQGPQSATVGRQVFAFEADSSSTRVTRYDLDTGAWNTESSTLAPLVEAAVADNDEKIYLFGGRSPSFSYYRTIMEYDPVTGQSSQVGTLPRTYSSASAVFIPSAPDCADGCFYLFGGYPNETRLVVNGGTAGTAPPVIQFDPELRTVTEIPNSLPGYVADMAGLALNGKAYLFGGYTVFRDSYGDFFIQNRKAYRFDPISKVVTEMSIELPFGLHRLITAEGDADGYLYGGNDANSNRLYVFDPASETLSWSFTGPVWTSNAAGAWDGSRFRIIGGTVNRILDEIITFDTSTREMVTSPARLPIGLANHAAIWWGDAVYIFGGQNFRGPSDRIYRFDPVAQVVTELGARLPSPRTRMSIVSDGTKIYLFGGYGTSGATAEIITFDPPSEDLETLPTQLPEPSGETTATWDGSKAIIFGGGTDSHDAIYLFNPSTRSISTSDLKLHTHGGPAFTVGHSQIVFATSVHKVNLTTGSVERMFMFDHGLHYSSAFTDGLSFFILRGVHEQFYSGFGNNWLHELRLTPGEPTTVTASRGTERGTITLGWSPPSPSTYLDTEPIQEYRVYRSATLGGPTTLAGSVTGSTTAFVDTGLPDGTTWFYRVSAVNARGEGPLSFLASAKTISVPGDVTLRQGISPGRGQIEVLWNAPDDGGRPITAYRVYTSKTSPANELLAQVDGSARSFVHTGLGDAEWRHYRVTAVNELGEGPFGPSQLYLVSPYPPSGARSPRAEVGPIPGGITITWDPAIHPGSWGWVVSYRVDRRTLLSGQSTTLITTTSTRFVDWTCPAAEVCYYSITSTNTVGDGPSTGEVFAAGSALP